MQLVDGQKEKKDNLSYVLWDKPILDVYLKSRDWQKSHHRGGLA